jgi:hypothetical protein
LRRYSRTPAASPACTRSNTQAGTAGSANEQRTIDPASRSGGTGATVVGGVVGWVVGVVVGAAVGAGEVGAALVAASADAGPTVLALPPSDPAQPVTRMASAASNRPAV